MVSLMISIALGVVVPLKPTLQLLNLAVAWPRFRVWGQGFRAGSGCVTVVVVGHPKQDLNRFCVLLPLSCTPEQ